MELEVYNAANDLPAIGEEFQGYNLLALSDGFDEQLQELIHRGSSDFDTWTSLISKIEKTYPDDIEKICLVYDSFLSEFPLCHGYWRKYAAHKAHLCSLDKVVEIYERAVQSATYCVGVWLEYCSFCMSAYEDPCDVRRLFKRALSFVGKDFLCHTLWDKYIEFEFSQQQWSFLAQICVQTLKFPTRRLHHYYDNFKKFVAILEEEMKLHDNCSVEMDSDSVFDAPVPTVKDEVSGIIKCLLDPSTGCFSYKALQKYMSIGEGFYQEACDLERKIHCFETNIQRSYFHIIPLEDNQLENWHRYLDFIERQEDFDWAVKLYERCLIPCAGYPEFWMRYVEFMETKGGREIANFALDRATKVFLKNVPAIHVFHARFKEQIGDRCGARTAYLWTDNEFSSHFVEKVVTEANMEKRLGNYAAASSVYEKALAMAAERQKLHDVPILYIHFSRLKYMMTGSVDSSRDVIMEGIQHVPHCKLLLEGLIHFLMMHGGLGQVNLVDNIIADAISPGSDASQGLGSKDREDISVLYLEFVDQCGTVHDITNAWNRHIKLFPHLVRTTSSNRLPSSGTRLLDILMGGRKKNPFPLPFRPSGGHNSDQLSQLPGQEQRLLLPEDAAIDPDRVTEYHVQREEEKKVNNLTNDSVDQSGGYASGEMESTPYLVNQSREDACEPMEATQGLVPPIESTHGLAHQPGEDIHEPMESTHGLVDQLGEDASEPIKPTNDLSHQVADDDADLDAPPEYCTNVQQEQDPEPEQRLTPLPLDGLPLTSQEKEYRDSLPVPYENQSPTSDRILENCQNPSIASPGTIRSVDSAPIQNESVNLSPMTNHPNPLPEQEQPELQEAMDGARDWHHIDNTVQASGDTRSGIRGTSVDEQNQQWQVSPQHRSLEHHPPAEIHAETSQGNSRHPSPLKDPHVQQGSQGQNLDQVGPAQGNLTGTNSWSTQNLQQQGFVSAHQSQAGLLPLPQAQMPQYSMQSQQFGNAAYNQAYNQMMENYFRQQMIFQQHQLQQQQFMQQQGQQAYQQQQQQQHLLQPYQQQEIYAQQQQQLAQFYYQQLPQMQEQQAQLMWQQLQHAHQQQGQLYYQVMQQQQAYQQPQQQYQMHQQQGYHQSYYQQGPQVMPPHSESAEPPHPQLQSQGATPPHRAGAFGSAVSSPHQPSCGVSPHSARASRPASSPYNKQ